MTEKEIQAFWQLPIQLKKMPADDPQRPMLEAALEDLACKMLADMRSQKETKPEDKPASNLDEAIQILATTCMQASMLEDKYLKDQIPEADRKAIAQARKYALVEVAEALGKVEVHKK